MYFDSFADFVAMDGHGAFVWSAWGISALVLVALVLVPLRKHRQLRAKAAQALRNQS